MKVVDSAESRGNDPQRSCDSHRNLSRAGAAVCWFQVEPQQKSTCSRTQGGAGEPEEQEAVPPFSY